MTQTGLSQRLCTGPTLPIAAAAVAILGAYPAFSASIWLKCTIDQYSGHGGDDPFTPMRPNIRIVVFDEAKRTVHEYINSQLVPPVRTSTINDYRIVARIQGDRGADEFMIDRLTGTVDITRGVGMMLTGMFRGACEQTEAMKIALRKL